MQMLLMTTLLFAGADVEPDALPKGPPPRLAVMSARDLMIKTVVTEQVPVTYQVQVEVIEGGKKVLKTETRTAMRSVSRWVEHSIKDVKATTAGGKKLTADAAAKALEKPRVVLISADGRPIDPAYLKLYKPDTPALVLPAGGSTVPGTTPPRRPRILPVDR